MIGEVDNFINEEPCVGVGAGVILDLCFCYNKTKIIVDFEKF